MFRKKDIIIFSIAAVLFSAVAYGLISISKNNESLKERKLSVLFTSDFNGRLEPCGCFTEQLGGLTRLGGWLKHHGIKDAIKLDIGDAISGTKDFQIEHYPYILKGFHKLGYNVLNVGKREAKLDADKLLSIAKESQVPLISANLEKNSGESFLPGFHSFERNGIKITCVGVVDEKKCRGKLGKGLRVRPMSIVLGEILPKLRKESDMLILMAMTDEMGLEKLKKEFIEVDIFLAGGVRQPSQEVKETNRSISAGISGDGKNVAIIEGAYNPKGFYKVKNYDIQLLYKQYPQDQNLINFSKEYREHIAKVLLNIDKDNHSSSSNIPGVSTEAHYVGSQACASCHAEEYMTWSRTGHAKAYDTLKRKNVHMDPACLKCHTVGLGEKTGFKRNKPLKHLEGVGCESCHGPGSNHIASRSSGKQSFYRMRPLSESDCIQCHYGEFSRPFKWQHFWPRVAHGQSGEKNK